MRPLLPTLWIIYFSVITISCGADSYSNNHLLNSANTDGVASADFMEFTKFQKEICDESRGLPGGYPQIYLTISDTYNLGQYSVPYSAEERLYAFNHYKVNKHTLKNKLGSKFPKGSMARYIHTSKKPSSKTDVSKTEESQESWFHKLSKNVKQFLNTHIFQKIRAGNIINTINPINPRGVKIEESILTSIRHMHNFRWFTFYAASTQFVPEKVEYHAIDFDHPLVADKDHTGVLHYYVLTANVPYQNSDTIHKRPIALVTVGSTDPEKAFAYEYNHYHIHAYDKQRNLHKIPVKILYEAVYDASVFGACFSNTRVFFPDMPDIFNMDDYPIKENTTFQPNSWFMFPWSPLYHKYYSLSQ